VRLATVNLRHGRSPGDGSVETGRLARALAALDADVLALQEVDRGQDRSHRTDQTEVAAVACGAVAAHFTAALAGSLGTGVRRADGTEADDAPAHGIAVVSRHPVSAWREIRLPPVPVPLPVRGGRGVRLAREEPRVALCARVEAPDGPFVLVTTQLSAVPGRSAVQLRRLAVVVLEQAGPLVLAGDLNLGGEAPARSTGLVPLATALTYPAHAPRIQVDHVLGRGVRPLAASAVPLPIGDHLALVVDLEVQGQDGSEGPAGDVRDDPLALP
jgi:endonuclease/exonuclease/phosphatase family metal-dependent hydrolase